MTKPKQFVYKVEASLTQEQGEFLEDMVRKGEADNISQAMRNCVKNHQLRRSLEAREKFRGEE